MNTRRSQVDTSLRIFHLASRSACSPSARVPGVTGIDERHAGVLDPSGAKTYRTLARASTLRSNASQGASMIAAARHCNEIP